jgi:hypothetical protein
MKTLKIMMMALMMCSVFTSCSSNEEKMVKSIKAYIQKNWNDPNSYESVSFEKIDTALVCLECKELFKEIENNSSYMDSSSKIMEYLSNNSESLSTQTWDSLRFTAKSFQNRYEHNYDSLNVLLKKAKTNNKNSEIDGFAVNHKLRISNKKGIKEIQEWRFFFDTELNVTDCFRVDTPLEEIEEDAEKILKNIERNL